MRLPVPAVALVGAVALALGATGCSNSKSAKPKTTTTVTRFAAPRPINSKPLSEGEGVCGFLTQAEITSTVGLAAMPGTGLQNADGGAECRWLVKGTGTQLVSVLEVVSDAKSYEDRERAQATGIQDLSGLGDRAFLASGAVYVIKGNKLIVVSVVTTQTEAIRKAAVTKLAQAAAGHF